MNIPAVNFSELTKESKEGKSYHFEPESTQANFLLSSKHLPEFWRKVFSLLTGTESIVIFLLFECQYTQEQAGDYLGYSQRYISTIQSRAFKKLKNHIDEFITTMVGKRPIGS